MKDGDGNLGGGVIHAPGCWLGKLVEVGVHLDVVLFINRQGNRHLFEPAVGQGVHARAADRDRGEVPGAARSWIQRKSATTRTRNE